MSGSDQLNFKVRKSIELVILSISNTIQSMIHFNQFKLTWNFVILRPSQVMFIFTIFPAMFNLFLNFSTLFFNLIG